MHAGGVSCVAQQIPEHHRGAAGDPPTQAWPTLNSIDFSLSNTIKAWPQPLKKSSGKDRTSLGMDWKVV